MLQSVASSEEHQNQRLSAMRLVEFRLCVSNTQLLGPIENNLCAVCKELQIIFVHDSRASVDHWGDI